MKDNIFSDKLCQIKDFDFDDKVAAVFPDMIRRSVPGYETIIKHLGSLSRRFVTDNSNIYDLGSSLGAATLSMRRNIENKGVHIYAIDNSSSMVSRSKKIIESYESTIDVTVIEDSIENVDIENASMVVLNFTLQFIEKSLRTQLLRKIAKGLNNGGLLVLSEKIHFDNPITQNFIDEMHLDFKRENGYSELEISQKREALQDILIPESVDDHRKRLLDAGFSTADIWFQQYNFASFVAIK